MDTREREAEFDTESVDEVLSGNPGAFERIVSRYTHPIYTLSYRMLGNRMKAEDAVQEIFILIFRKLHKYDRRKRFYTWMFTVALNYLRSELRRKRDTASDASVSFDGNMINERGFTQGDNPEDEVIRGEAEKAVQSSLLVLEPRFREVFILREIEGLSVKETSAVLKIPENTVKTLSRRGKEKLKKILLSRDWGETL